jgi:circadian clock protein KaiC
MVTVLTGMGITMVMTAEVEDSYTDLRFSPHGTAFLTDAIIMQRYIAFKGQLRRIMSVVKVRSSVHSKELRAYEITGEGLLVDEVLTDYDGLLTGSPELLPASASESREPKPPARPGKRRARR